MKILPFFLKKMKKTLDFPLNGWYYIIVARIWRFRKLRNLQMTNKQFILFLEAIKFILEEAENKDDIRKAIQFIESLIKKG